MKRASGQISSAISLVSGVCFCEGGLVMRIAIFQALIATSSVEARAHETQLGQVIAPEANVDSKANAHSVVGVAPEVVVEPGLESESESVQHPTVSTPTASRKTLIYLEGSFIWVSGAYSLRFLRQIADSVSLDISVGQSYLFYFFGLAKFRGGSLMARAFRDATDGAELAIGVVYGYRTVHSVGDCTDDGPAAYRCAPLDGYVLLPTVSIGYRSVSLKSGIFYRVSAAWTMGYGIGLPALAFGYAF